MNEQILPVPDPCEAPARPGRIAIVCNGCVPGSRLPSGAQGLRAYGLHLGLRAAGHDCDIVTRQSTVRAQLDRWNAPSMRFPGHWRVVPNGLLEKRLKSDYTTIIFIGWVGIDAFAKAPGQRIVYDFFSPSMVEHSFISSGGRLEAKRSKKEELIAQADHLIANGTGRAEYGADYMRASPPLAHLPAPLSVRLALPWAGEAAMTEAPPQGKPAQRPVHGGPLRVFFGGFDQAWTRGLDAGALEDLTGLDGVEVTAIGVGEHLHFHDRASRLTRRRPQGRVIYHDVAAFETYRRLNAGSHVSLDVFERNAERELCYSTRAITSLCNGCPVITMAFTEVGQLVAETGAGWVLEAFSLTAIRDLVVRLASDREEVRARARNTRIFWERHCDPEHEIRPLVEVL